jgi:hypothetical protein
MELTLHLGAHRTGSTALQQTLHRGRADCAAEGIEYWGPKVMRGRNLKSYTTNARRAAETPEFAARARAAVAEVEGAVNALRASGRRHLVVSEENMIGSMEWNFRAGKLYPNVHRNLTAYRALFPLRPSRIFIAIRDYASYWASSYSQCQLYGDMPKFDTARLATAPSERGWVEVLGEIAEVFPDARIVTWRYSSDPAVLGGALAEMLGPELARKLPMAPETTNASLTVKGLEHFGRIRRQAGKLSVQERRDTVSALRSVGGPLFQPFSESELAGLAACYAADCAAIAGGKVAGVEVLGAQPAGVAR